MTKSTGVGRGGSRPGAGRRPKAVDWDAVARAYFTSEAMPETICEKFGISLGDLFVYSQSEGWLHKPSKPHPMDCGRLGSALALNMFSIDGTAKRARCFVSAMLCLEASDREIADALEIRVETLRSEFSSEISRARTR